MQTQQHKPAKQDSSPKQRLHVGEVVVAVLNLLIGATAASIAFDCLSKLADSSVYAVSGAPAAIAAFGALSAGLLIFLRQRRLAIYGQWLGTIGLTLFWASMIWVSYHNREGVPLNGQERLAILAAFVPTLIFAWFAWFLKRMDESE
jgi:Na+/proline symporter